MGGTCPKTRLNKGFQRGTFSLQPLNYSTFKTAKNRAISSQQRPKGTFDENSPLFRLSVLISHAKLLWVLLRRLP